MASIGRGLQSTLALGEERGSQKAMSPGGAQKVSRQEQGPSCPLVGALEQVPHGSHSLSSWAPSPQGSLLPGAPSRSY